MPSKKGAMEVPQTETSVPVKAPVVPPTKLVSSTGRKGTYEHVTTNNPVDQHVGRSVRERRLLLGLSQAAVAQQIGVTGQQYQKYEKGENRISASRLFDVANVLRVPVSHFFEGMSEQTRDASPAHILGGATPPEIDLPLTTGYARRQTLELLRLWQQLPDHARGRVVDLVRSMVDLSTETGRTSGGPDDSISTD